MENNAENVAERKASDKRNKIQRPPIGKLQYLTSLFVTIIIALLTVTPLFTFNVKADDCVYDRGFSDLLQAASQIKSTQISEDTALSEEEKSAQLTQLTEEYSKVIYIFSGTNKDGEKSEEVTVSTSIVKTAVKIPQLIKFAPYYFKALVVYSAREDYDRLLANPPVITNYDSVEEYMYALDSHAASLFNAQKTIAEATDKLNEAIKDPDVVNEDTASIIAILFSDPIFYYRNTTQDSVWSAKMLSAWLPTIARCMLVVITVFIFPVLMLAAFIRALRATRTKKKESHMLGISISTVMRLSLILAALSAYSGGFTLSGAVMLSALAVVILVNLSASRSIPFNDESKMHMTLARICTVISTSGAAMFFVGFSRANLFNFFIGREISQGFIPTSIPDDRFDPMKKAAIAFFVLFGISFIMFISMWLIYRGSVSGLLHASCMCFDGATSPIVSPIIMIGCIIASKVLIGKYNAALPPEQNTALTLAMIGLAIMTLFNIIYCKFTENDKEEDIQSIMFGAYKTDL